jgi:hypothetical protein
MMGYLTSSASVSSSYSATAGRGVQFKDQQHPPPPPQQQQDVLTSLALDNKYLKRWSQIERQRRYDMENSLCGGESCCATLTNHPIFQLSTKLPPHNHRQHTTLMLVLVCMSLCSFWFLAGWLSANYVFVPTSATTTTEEKSLKDLAESIRRMRLRRQHAFHGPTFEDDATVIPLAEEDINNLKRLGHRYYNDMDPPEPRDEFELLKNSEEEAKRLERLEQRIRATQDHQVKKELEEKRMEDKMEESIQALKELTNHYAALEDTK